MSRFSDDSRFTVFVDLDGTLVMFNHNPDTVDDIVISSLAEFLLRNREKYCLVVTTSRNKAFADRAVSKLVEYGLNPDHVLHSLPTGVRMLINDHKKGEDNTAFAINVLRDQGL